MRLSSHLQPFWVPSLKKEKRRIIFSLFGLVYVIFLYRSFCATRKYIDGILTSERVEMEKTAESSAIVMTKVRRSKLLDDTSIENASRKKPGRAGLLPSTGLPSPPRGRISNIVRTGAPLASNDAVSKRENKLPILILHVGPPKTGTTTLQKSLLTVAQRLWEEDGVFYYHRGRTSRWPNFDLQSLLVEFGRLMNKKTMNPNPNRNYNEEVAETLFTRQNQVLTAKAQRISAQKQQRDLASKINLESVSFQKFNPQITNFYSVLNEYKEKDPTAVIISVEQWADHDVLSVVPFEGWDVRVVITYRRYFEWVTSKYFQENTANPTKPMETFGMFFNQTLRHKDGLGTMGTQLHPTAYAIAKMGANYNHIQLMNFHEATDWPEGENGFLTYFVCQVLGKLATHTCEHLKPSTQAIDKDDETTNVVSKFSHSRTSKRIDYQQLVKAAMQKHGVILWPPSRTSRLLRQQPNDFSMGNREFRKVGPMHEFRKLVSAAIDFNKGLQSLPLQCVSEDRIKILLNMSLAFERELMSADWASSTEETHVATFQHFLATQKFCDVDHQLLLQETKWNHFFDLQFQNRDLHRSQQEIIKDMQKIRNPMRQSGKRNDMSLAIKAKITNDANYISALQEVEEDGDNATVTDKIRKDM